MSSAARLARALAWLGLALALGGALAAALAGLGHRWGWWDFRTGFAILRWAAYLGLLAAAGSLVAALMLAHQAAWRSLAVAVLGFVLAVASVAGPWSQLREARRAPPIHDITTDLTDPPQFVEIVPLRAGAPNPLDRSEPGLAEMQQAGYPELAAKVVDLPPEQALQRAISVAHDLGWQVVAAVPEEGRLEAVDETLWFGFKDDVVVRIRPAGRGSRVDVRSVSRVGRGDAGANARRIRAFLAKLEAAASTR